MNLEELTPSGRDIKILHPATEEEVNVTVSILSINDPAMVKIKRKITDDRLALERRGKGFKANDIEENRDILTFAAMTGWKWSKDAKFKGAKPEFNRKNVLAVFKELPWFRDQVEEAVSDDKAFF